jgi:pimeloyl-ACP methyl ester carboxylesterase
MRRLLVLLVPALIAATAAAPAQAAVAWAPCPDEGFQAFECARLAVPLDRGGAGGGETIELFARRLRAPSNPTNTALVALAGGPGQPAAPVAAAFAVALAPGLKDRDLLVFDQRGTGRSGALSCPSLGRVRNATRAVGACASHLGARRGFYRTSDSVADLEDLRRAAGYDRLALYGVSYGTKVALDYAASHGERVERMVLDSTVPHAGPDPLARSSFTAVRRILREQCAAGRCRGVTPDALGDARRLVRRSRPVKGAYRDGRGRRRTAEADGGAVYLAYRLTDLNPAFRAMLPGAVRAAVRGDATPLLRVLSQVAGPSGGSVARFQADDENNSALNLATLCEEIAFPWDRGASVERRADQATDVLLATPASVFSPFDRQTAAQSGLLSLCLGWPHATPPPAPPGALPAVPTLELTGAADIRTPVEDARGVAARIPSAPALVVVPHVGHSVLGGDPSGCARAAIAQFFREGTATACPRSRPLVPPLALPARRLGDLPTTARVRGTAGRTLTAVLRTRDDALAAALGAQIEGRTTRVGGVRGGVIALRGDDVVLRDVQWMRGVRVTGTFAGDRPTARVRVRGSGARGSLTFHRDGRVTGRLGGRRVRIRPVARSAAARTAPRDWTGFSALRRLVPLTRAAQG